MAKPRGENIVRLAGLVMDLGVTAVAYFYGLREWSLAVGVTPSAVVELGLLGLRWINGGRKKEEMSKKQLVEPLTEWMQPSPQATVRFANGMRPGNSHTETQNT